MTTRVRRRRPGDRRSTRRCRPSCGRAGRPTCVYPLVEESEKIDLADATQGARGAADAFARRRVGLLHGRMKQREKDAVMARFRAGRDRGAGLHHGGRGGRRRAERVGDGDRARRAVRPVAAAPAPGAGGTRARRESYCFLLPAPARSPEARARLEVMEQSNDGFVIAEKDLELRGPGRIPRHAAERAARARVANLARDQAISAVAPRRRSAIAAGDPRLARPEHRGLLRALEERWEGQLSLARVG